MGQQFVGDFAGVAGDDLKHRRRQSRFVKNVGQQKRGERHLLRGFEEHAVIGGDRRHDLVRHLVHRVIERRNRRNHAKQRIALCVHAPFPTVRGDVAREYLAVVLQGGMRAEQQHVAHATGFVAAVLLAQA